MRVIIQRVLEAKVSVDAEVVGSVKKGLLIFLGVHNQDQAQHIDYMVDKIFNLRIFEDQNGKFNLSILDVKGEVLIVSQFTLYADCSKGRRPSFVDAANPQLAEKIYDQFVEKFRSTNLKIATGKFQAHMQVYLINDGPVTIMLEK